MRRFRSRLRGGAKRKMYRKRRLIKRVGLRQPIQYFKQTQYYQNWLTTSTTIEVLQNVIFTLSAVSQANTFQNLYDQYCIKGVKCTLIPRGNVDVVATPYGSPTFSCIDYDGNFPASISALNEYQSAKQTRSTSLHKRYLKPKVSLTTYQSPAFNSYAPRGNMWIDCGTPAAQHYGLTYAVLPTPAQTVSYDLKVEYYLAFKNVR